MWFKYEKLSDFFPLEREVDSRITKKQADHSEKEQEWGRGGWAYPILKHTMKLQ